MIRKAPRKNFMNNNENISRVDWTFRCVLLRKNCPARFLVQLAPVQHRHPVAIEVWNKVDFFFVNFHYFIAYVYRGFFFCCLIHINPCLLVVTDDPLIANGLFGERKRKLERRIEMETIITVRNKILNA